MFFLFAIIAFCSDQKLVTNLEDQFTLFSPAVDENGRSYRYKFYNDYIIKAYSSEATFVQLGYAKGLSSAAMETKTPMPFSDFRADVKFMIIPSKIHGDGFGVFLSQEQFKSGSLLGRDSNFNGISVQVITKGKTPVIKLTIDDQVQEENLKGDIYNTWCVLRLENYEKTFRVIIMYGKENPVHVFNVYNSKIKNDTYFSISASNTIGFNSIRIQDVKISSLVSISAKKTVKRKSSIWVWIVLIGAVIALGYYVLRKQIKIPQRRL